MFMSVVCDVNCTTSFKLDLFNPLFINEFSLFCTTVYILLNVTDFQLHVEVTKMQ